ncbi:polysaccharide deacetylase family protein [Anaerobacillus isosaccharinicus]|uniref:Polysaccharide deacetylase family protein n=1 Tax=Anaerobacillus isosaccharinicus TaxID=1532552 RepID=A0A1S2LAH8_9BACI|nr:polysaccharide deacetylase family protein [Anaerobacillus isosaccharinicus]MBA5588116.1 polysaccharide deacetylase family protein [Anaerobacillus isosaccharinicus]QOY38427.1 polysaccharide deacetylase family protein [Anaerobacillus isosaccharinicus]
MRRIILIMMVLVLFFTITVFFKEKEQPMKFGEDHSKYNVSHDLVLSTRFNSDLLQSIANIDLAQIKNNTDYKKQPIEWGENVTGVIRNIPTDEQIIALTFDACGGEWGSGYDDELINYLIAENIPATLFFNSRWIDTNLDKFLYLSSLEQFQIENHGTEHRPLSVNGLTAWGIKGTSNVEEVVEEVISNYEKIKMLTGHSSKYFRSGTAFYDEVAVKIVNELGMNVVNYDILGDAGATFSAQQVKDSLLNSKPGSIALLHMNQPKKETAEGVKMAVPLLREKGFTFVTLDEGFNRSNR